ncbi:hypothetical protein ABZ079_14015 [Streptomyces sp. NPDC006314]|uniref:hypothetical protein n=1 Tax=Streptomyces sp. NPDC006314 TaxID=3154475 RepID=UPI0033AFE6D4
MTYPERTGALLVLATAAASVERIARANPRCTPSAATGTGRAATARTPATGHAPACASPAAELQVRFGRLPQGPQDPRRGGPHRVESYLGHHAAKPIPRFDAAGHVVLTEAINAHVIDRGGPRAALARVTARTWWPASTPSASVRSPSSGSWPPWPRAPTGRGWWSRRTGRAGW